MNCPMCSAKTRVYETSRRGPGERRRECLGPSKHRFKTTELVTAEVDRLREHVFRLDRLRRLLQEEIT